MCDKLGWNKCRVIAEHICDEIKLCDVQLKSEAEAELRTAQEGCAGVLALLEARDSDV